MRNVKSLTVFNRSNSGSVAVIFAVSIMVLMGTTALAVDASRAYTVSMRVTSILDAAALAGAKLLTNESATDAQITAAAGAYFELHASKKTLPGLSLTGFKVTIDRANTKVKTDVDVGLLTTFANVMGVGSFTFHRTSEVAMKIKKMEIAMVLDITGSMNDNGKLPAMKLAASDMIDNLMQNSPSESAVRIAVAPFSASVNAGALANKVSSSPAVTSCGYTFYFGYKCTTSVGADVDTCVIERSNSRAATDDAPTGSDILPAVPSTPYGNYNCPNATVVPLLGKSSAGTIKSTINGYSASGATAGHIGAAWGWYLISPKWAGVLPGSSAPAAYNDANVTKYVIFLTDGIFNTSYKTGPSTMPNTQMDESYAQFQALCSNMKSAGVTVFTVALDLLDPRALTELQACGGGNSYTAVDGPALRSVFQQIVSNLNQLHVTH